MKHKLSTTLALVVLTVALAAATARAQTVANGPYYAPPAWDQQLPASTRFIVLSNWIDASHPSGGAAVLDRETGLVWARSPEDDSASWGFAVDHCNTLKLGNRMGWRLPAIQELASLIDLTAPINAVGLPSGHPFQNVLPSVYWSASTSAELVGGFGWAALFGGTHGVFRQGKSVSSLVWCVRGQQGVEPHVSGSR